MVGQNQALMFEQVPLVEMDGLQLVQSKAIMNYIAEKYKLSGKDLKERAMIDMYTEGLNDLMEMIMILPFKKPDEKQAHIGVIQGKATSRYFPVYEKALNSSQYLVGNQFSRADVHLMEATLMLEELFPTILSTFPNLKAFQGRMRSLPTIRKFPEPGSQRKPQPDAVYLKNVGSSQTCRILRVTLNEYHCSTYLMTKLSIRITILTQGCNNHILIQGTGGLHCLPTLSYVKG
ncbi:glutathione S-transferase, alpha tandem duplicate 1 isoform X2 [Alosa sapidissima]|uniref:glutathione S-transferase, alpha tandem duplicate 1 isoform X2 n=1 Tax=Alosa sapidissima TaxID=34773 RepID=UPI001C09DEF9|nr:glutathione S-transferase, alpha tandem duplicate 1 isoform X2 [Alosa sapidissima]